MLISTLPAAGNAAEPEQSAGTVYLSISDDARYVEGNDDRGTLMAYVPMDLAEVSKIKLDDYQLSAYAQDMDEDGKEDITLLHLFLYASEHYYLSTDADALVISGGSGSMFMSRFWGHDCNLTYYVNGSYPEQSPGWGATADIIPLHDGDFIDLSMYTSWGFFSDSAAGYHYFLDTDNKIIHDYTAVSGTAMPLWYGRAWSSGMDGGTVLSREANATIYYSQTLYAREPASVTTDANGAAAITFPTSGTWYLWADGQPGVDADPDNIVSSPAYAKVTVSDAAADAVIAQINALPAVDALTLDDADAVAAAQAAYDALTEAQKALIPADVLAVLAAAQARITELANAQPEPTPVELPFTDVEADAWYHDAVSYVYANGLMNGMSPDTFAPQDTTTRAMTVTLLYRMSGSPAVTGSNPFTDVEAGRYFTKAVIWAAENGIVKGVSADTFQPDGAVTREQLATFLYRYAAFRSYDVSARADLSRYTDAEQVSNYAKDAMSWAVAAGIISGNKIDGAVVLDAQGAANRAQIATVLMRFCESVAK